jgi:hypothetical protein
MVKDMILHLFGLTRIPVYRGKRIIGYYMVSRRFAERYSRWLRKKRRARKKEEVYTAHVNK